MKMFIFLHTTATTQHDGMCRSDRQIRRNKLASKRKRSNGTEYICTWVTHTHTSSPYLTTRTFLTWFFLKYSIIYYIIYSNEWNPHTTTTLYFIFFLIYATLLISSCFVCVCGGEISFGWFSFGPGMGVVDSKTKQKRVSSMES